jgi:Na+/alanine symporter
MAPYVRSAGNRLVFRHPDALGPVPALRTSMALGVSSRGGAQSRISFFQAFCIGLASRVALLGTATAFAEATLAQVFKVALPDGTFRSGPAF